MMVTYKSWLLGIWGGLLEDIAMKRDISEFSVEKMKNLLEFYQPKEDPYCDHFQSRLIALSKRI